MARKGNNKKSNSKKIEEVTFSDTNIGDKLFIVGCVLLFIFAFYLLTLYITNKNTVKTDDDSSQKVEVSSEYIILGRSLNMNNDEYFVICYDKGNTLYDEIVTNYKNKNELSIYKVDMNSAFNKKYATDGESNKNPSKVADFLINGPTLMRIKNKKVVDYIEGEEDIRNYLN